MTLPSRLSVLIGALLLSIPALALLQYRWVGQLSEAERERMLRNVRHSAAQFHEAFDGEIGRALIGLQVDSAVLREEAWDRYAERYAAWSSTATYPGLVVDVFLIDDDGSAARLRRWNGTARRFEPAPWEGPFADARAHFEAVRAGVNGPGQGGPVDARPFRADPSLVAVPVFNVRILTNLREELHQPLVTMFGFTVLRLSLPVVREQMVPALVQRFFADSETLAYRLAVISRDNPDDVVFRSAPEVAIDPGHADVDEPVFGTRIQALMVHTPGTTGERPGTRNIVVSLVRQGAEGAAATSDLERSDGRWRLLVQHQRGSLEAAVTAARQRNLMISFGILLLVGVSVGLLALTSRRAQALARQQMEFVAGVSHELRTPVAVIRSAAENLSHGTVDEPDHVRRYGDAIQVEARRLGEMVERVLQFAGIESGQPLPRVPLHVDALIDEGIDAARQHGGRELVLERAVAPGLPPVVGDPVTLRAAIQNLLANAIKYGGADGWVGIRADASETGREVRITVEDHGRGISSTELPRIFDPFYRGAEASVRRLQGSGLGLALARRIALEHGGRLTVVSRPGSGSAFTLHLPAADGVLAERRTTLAETMVESAERG